MLAEENRRETTAQGTYINLKSSWFWALLDPDISQPAPNTRPDDDTASGAGSNPDEQMCLNTDFTHPLQTRHQSSAAEQLNCLDSAPDSLDSFLISPESIEQFHVDDLSYGLFQQGFY